MVDVSHPVVPHSHSSTRTAASATLSTIHLPSPLPHPPFPVCLILRRSHVRVCAGRWCGRPAPCSGTSAQPACQTPILLCHPFWHLPHCALSLLTWPIAARRLRARRRSLDMSVLPHGCAVLLTLFFRSSRDSPAGSVYCLCFLLGMALHWFSYYRRLSPSGRSLAPRRQWRFVPVAPR